MALTLTKPRRPYIAIIDGDGTVIDAEPAAALGDNVEAFEVACLVDCLTTLTVTAVDRFDAITTAQIALFTDQG